MHKELNQNSSYSKNLILLCISSALFAFACVLIGYLALPFAAASYAALLKYEKSNKRIFSYIIPVAIYAINVSINGFFSLEGFIYVTIGLMLFLFEHYSRSKNETAFWITLALSVFVVLSFISLGFTSNSSLSFSALRAYYAGIYDSFKRIFITLISGLSSADEEGTLFFLFTRENAEQIFHSLLLALPSFIVIFAFLLTGLSFKIFYFLKIRIFSERKETLEIFIPTKFLAYTYISFVILSFLSSSSEDILALSIANVYNVLLTVFAYFGLKIVYSFVKSIRGTFFALLLVIVAFVMFTTTAVTLLSYFGVFFAISAKKQIIEK